ncbi:MAG TPA: Jag N-terminal domain-containing protein [Candidatus Pullichristensenella stercoripullorum]|nr:Jag N-terminal domain-containing protein [Candidatus Pullichristensenella stercoripullorum]
MKTIESSGKTVKDAINQGAKELGCDPSDLEIEVLEMGSPGLFGMFGRLARVKLTLKEADDDFNIDMPAMTLEQPAQKQGRQHRQEKPKPAPVPQETAQEETAQKEPSRRSRQRARKERAPEEKPVEAEIVITPPEPEAPFVETAYDQLSDDAKRAMEFLSGMIERMGVQAELKACETPEQLRVQLFGENMSLLIGRRGETLDALQYLTSLNVNRGREEYLRVSLDTENYRAKREEALRKLAARMANRCRKTGKRVALEPMNPYERRILHSALQADPTVTTHSEGEEPYRRVIITLK